MPNIASKEFICPEGILSVIRKITVYSQKNGFTLKIACFDEHKHALLTTLKKTNMIKQWCTKSSIILEPLSIQHTFEILKNDALIHPTFVDLMTHQMTDDIIACMDTNEEKLKNIYFSEDELSDEEKESYKSYCCAIGYNIMTEPYYDPRDPRFQFEGTAIKKWLSINPMHPFTTKPLTIDMLQFNAELMKNINQFVEEQLLEFYQRSSFKI